MAISLQDEGWDERGASEVEGKTARETQRERRRERVRERGRESKTGQDNQGLNTFVFSGTKLVLTAATFPTAHTHTHSHTASHGENPAMLKINYSSVL